MTNKRMLAFLTLTILISLSYSQNIPEPPTFSKESGFYESKFDLKLSSLNETPIYYTIDGTDPTSSKSSQKYTSPIAIIDRTPEKNIYSEYQGQDNSPISITIKTRYNKPQYLVDKAMVVRAAAKNNTKFSKIVSKIYFVTNKNLSEYEQYTVVSLVTNPENLFDPEIGIYVAGNQYIKWTHSPDYDPRKPAYDTDNPCNYFMNGPDWEREATFSLFEKGKLAISQDVGIRLKGHAARSNAQKSFNIFAREKYGGATFKIPDLFPENYDIKGNKIDEYESITLRSANDESRLRDTLALNIIKDSKYLSTYNTKSTVLFINGEYWGLYILMENTNSETFGMRYYLPGNDIVVIKENEIEDGIQEDVDNYQRFTDKYSKLDLSNNKYYQEVSNNFDFDSLIEHYVIGIYLGTSDWPNRNFGIWKYNERKIIGNPYTDGKWRFFSYDFDNSMGKTSMGFLGYEGFAYDNFRHLYKRLDKYPGAPTDLFMALLKNVEFRNKFVNAFCDFSFEVASLEKTEPIIEYFKENYSALIANSQVRWSGQREQTRFQSFTRYKSNYENQVLSGIKLFLQERRHYALGHMKRFFELQGDLHEITIAKKGDGLIKINTIIPELKDDIWKGKYFSGIPITISAIPSEKSVFIGWTGDIVSDENSIIIDLLEDKQIEANFEEIE